MGKTLIITEKPSVAADIARVVKASKKTTHGYESDSHVVSWAVGHMLGFVAPEVYEDRFKRWRLQDLPIIPEAFQQEPVRGVKKQLAALKKYLKSKDVDTVVNACDAGREGELIFQEIYRFSGVKKPVGRLWLQSMTDRAITESLNSVREGSEFQGLADAADCRAESDWLIGINATRALTVRLRSSKDRIVWSAGRVQTATLSLLVHRELDILSHVPEPFWQIVAAFKAENHSYDATWYDPDGEGRVDRIHTEKVRDRVIAALETTTVAKAKETRKDQRRIAPTLFDLTSLQKEANKRFGFSARRTLKAAQQLYEAHKLLTYPRTDSKALPEEYSELVPGVVRYLGKNPAYASFAKTLAASGLQNQKRNFDNSAISDHFAIIPTGEGDFTGLTGDPQRIFDLVARRFLASFHPPAIVTEVERITTLGDELFRTRKTVLKEPGWRAVDGKESEDAALALPPLGAGGESVSKVSFEVEEKETQPPGRINEGQLLGMMETAGRVIEDDALAQVLKETGGLGTPATRADIIETLLSRLYIERCTGVNNRKAFRATARGVRLIDALTRIELPRLTSAAMTADLETALRDVEAGNRERSDYMNEIRSFTEEIVDRVKGFSYDTLYDGTEALGSCPKCKAEVRETLRTYSCVTDREECDFLLWKEAGGRYVDRTTAKTLLENGETGVKVGFFTRDAREYEASFVFKDDFKVKVISKGHEDGGTLEAVEELDVAPCCQCDAGQIRRTNEGYVCTPLKEGGEGCGFKLPLTLCQRILVPEEITVLVGEARKTEVLEGFISKRNRPFKAALSLNEKGKIGWEFPPRDNSAGGGRAAAKEFEVNSAPLGTCVCSSKGTVVETSTEFVCDADDCKRKIPREIFKREVTREEAQVLFTKGETEVLDNFVSKAGKPFGAQLYFKKSGRHGFRFPER